MTDNEVGVEYFKTGEGFGYVTCFEFFCSCHGYPDLFVFNVIIKALKVDFLEVKDNVSNIFLNSGHSVKFVFHTVNSHG